MLRLLTQLQLLILPLGWYQMMGTTYSAILAAKIRPQLETWWHTAAITVPVQSGRRWWTPPAVKRLGHGQQV
jgi:hypothetical protein